MSTPTGESSESARPSLNSPEVPPAGNALEPPTATIKVLKALSHPVRQRVFKIVETRGFARAADVAEELGLPANQISFHLRVLANADMIKEAPEKARDKRDRVWTTNPGTWQLGSAEAPVPDESLGVLVGNWVTSELHDVLRRVEMWMPEVVTGRDPEVHGTLMNSSLWLTEAEFKELLYRLSSVIEDYREKRLPGDAEARRWQVGIIAADDTI